MTINEMLTRINELIKAIAAAGPNSAHFDPMQIMHLEGELMAIQQSVIYRLTQERK